jgi:hypothetical protein
MLKKARDCPQTPSKPVIYPLATPQELRIVAKFTNQNGNPQGEDCLYLNIWSKSTSKANKPVVFFYSGSNCNFAYSIHPICTATNTFRRMVNWIHKLPALRLLVPSRFPRRNSSHRELSHQHLRLPRCNWYFSKPRSPRPTSSRRMGSRQHRFFLRRPIEGHNLRLVIS